MVYIYPEKDLRAYPGTIRGTEEWDNTYKIRTVDVYKRQAETFISVLPYCL